MPTPDSTPASHPASMQSPSTGLLITESRAKLSPVLRSALEATHYEVIDCQSAVDCLAQFAHCDAVLVDLFLEDLDGLSLLEELRQANRDIPLIAFACHERLREVELSADDISAQASSSGADAVYIAPFNLGELIATLDRLTALSPAA